MADNNECNYFYVIIFLYSMYKLIAFFNDTFDMRSGLFCHSMKIIKELTRLYYILLYHTCEVLKLNVKPFLFKFLYSYVYPIFLNTQSLNSHTHFTNVLKKLVIKSTVTYQYLVSIFITIDFLYNELHPRIWNFRLIILLFLNIRVLTYYFMLCFMQLESNAGL